MDEREIYLYVTIILHVIVENMHVKNGTTINEAKGIISSNGIEDSYPAS